MIRSRVGLGLLFTFLTLQEGAFRLSPPSKPLSRQTRPGCPISAGPALAISPGRLTECELQSGDKHTFLMSVKPDQLLEARVSQLGVDAIVTLLDPEEKILLRMDSPNGGQGEEPVLAVADQIGEYRLRVEGAGRGWSGIYRLSIEEPRLASSADRVRASAFRSMADGDQLVAHQLPEQAVQRLRLALRAWESVRDTRGQLLALERLVLVLSGQREHVEALAACSKGTTLAKGLRDPIAEGRFTNLAGLVYLDLKEWEEAQDLFERAQKFFELGEDLQGQALVRNNFGVLAEERGRLQEALNHYETALQLWENEIEDPAQHANTLINLGEVLLAMGEPAEALNRFNQALDLLRRQDRRDLRFAALHGAGLAYNELGLMGKAFWAHNLALGLADHPRERARTLHRLGQVYSSQKDFQQARTLLEEALGLARSVEDLRLQAYALADLANLDRLRESWLEAIRKFDEARALFEELEIPLYVASTLFGLAETERDMGRLEDAVESVKLSVDIMESLRADLTETRFRVSFFASRHRFYELYIELLMEMHRRDPGAGYDVEAFEASENARARTLLDDMAGGGRPATRAMTLEEIQRDLLDRDSLLLAYSLGKLRSYLWAVSRDGIETFELPPREVVNGMALRAWRGLSQGEDNAEIETLSRMLFPEGLGLPAGTRLLVSPDGGLYLIPFAALKGREGRRLGSDLQVVYELSASVQLAIQRKVANRPTAPKAIAAIADPVFMPDDSRLNGITSSDLSRGESRNPGIQGLKRLGLSQKEAREILRSFPEDGRFLAIGFDANRSTALDPALGEHRIIHFATHHVIGADPEKSGLVLSLYDEQGRPTAGLLTATEIYNLNLPAELVVLSACGTGLAEEVEGEGPMGLARAFLHAGAKRVVVSLWDVEDGATAELMTRFYRSMLDDRLPAAEALRAAQASMADDPRWKSPRHWAPFILIGEPD